jgi:putative restriction endonuclease
LIKIRINQNTFRQIVLTNYQNKCAISDLDIPELLVASHIIPWAKNEKERMNPENGICLSVLYDKAFDKGLIGIRKSYEIIVSSRLSLKSDACFFKRFFGNIAGLKLNLPKKYQPAKEFLEYHLDNIFVK